MIIIIIGFSLMFIMGVNYVYPGIEFPVTVIIRFSGECFCTSPEIKSPTTKCRGPPKARIAEIRLFLR